MSLCHFLNLLSMSQHVFVAFPQFFIYVPTCVASFVFVVILSSGVVVFYCKSRSSILVRSVWHGLRSQYSLTFGVSDSYGTRYFELQVYAQTFSYEACVDYDNLDSYQHLVA